MKLILLTFIMVTVSFVSMSQIRHVRGISSVEAGYGTSKFGPMYYGSFVKYYGTKLYGKYTGFFEQGKDSGIDYQSVAVDGGLAYSFFKIGESVYINGTGGLTLMVDKLTKGAEQFVIDTTFKYGVYLGMESEIFISDKFVLVVGGSQRYVMKQNFGNSRYYLTAGVRFNF